MPFELRLTFSGLTALVPHTEGDPNQATEWLVMMPALKGGDILQLPTEGQNGRSFPIAPHQAMLMVNEQAVRGGTTKPPFLRRFPSPQDNSSYLLFNLDQELLEVNSGVPGLQLAPASQAADLPNLQVPDQVHDLKWVPPMDECLNMQVRFNKQLLNPQTLLPSRSLAGIVKLDRGLLETRDVHRGTDHGNNTVPVPYEFRKIEDGAPRFRRALADGFHARNIMVEGNAILSLKDHQGNQKKIVVGPYQNCPTNEQGRQLVEIKIFNEEMDRILGLSGPLNYKDADKGDIDFMIFYRLSTTWSTLSFNDLVIPYMDHDGGGGDSRPCEPPQYFGLGG